MSKTRRPYPTRDELGEQFAAKFHASHSTGEGCWEWTRAKDGHGYGAVAFNRRVLLAHRLRFGSRFDSSWRLPPMRQPGLREPRPSIPWIAPGEHGRPNTQGENRTTQGRA